jgi:hypothetical protein
LNQQLLQSKFLSILQRLIFFYSFRISKNLFKGFNPNEILTRDF